MGTHPIFESDFDCLTDNISKQCLDTSPSPISLKETMVTWLRMTVRSSVIQMDVVLEIISTMKSASVELDVFGVGMRVATVSTTRNSVKSITSSIRTSTLKRVQFSMPQGMLKERDFLILKSERIPSFA